MDGTLVRPGAAQSVGAWEGRGAALAVQDELCWAADLFLLGKETLILIKNLILWHTVLDFLSMKLTNSRCP